MWGEVLIPINPHSYRFSLQFQLLRKKSTVLVAIKTVLPKNFALITHFVTLCDRILNMGTVNTAVLVDFDLYELDADVRLWCAANKNKASFVLLVTEPSAHDYTPDTELNINEPDWQAVIRNKAGTPDIVFKTSALCVLQEHSNLLPTVAIDGDPEIQQMFRDGGVLVSGTTVGWE